MTRYGGTSTATSYETLWTRWAALASSVISGSESSPTRTTTRSYGSTVLRPGAATIGSEPSTGPHWTSTMSIGSRLLRASERRPSIIILPINRQSSVRPSKAMPGRPEVGLPPDVAEDPLSGAFFRLRKSKGTSLLRRARVFADGVDHAFIGQ